MSRRMWLNEQLREKNERTEAALRSQRQRMRLRLLVRLATGIAIGAAIGTAIWGLAQIPEEAWTSGFLAAEHFIEGHWGWVLVSGLCAAGAFLAFSWHEMIKEYDR